MVTVYKLWHESLPNFPKAQRFTIGSKIDTCFIQTIEATITASTLTKHEKLPHLDRAVTRLDLLKFFLYLAWEVKAIDTKKYILFSEKLDEIGRQLGGWKKQLGIVLPRQ